MTTEHNPIVEAVLTDGVLTHLVTEGQDHQHISSPVSSGMRGRVDFSKTGVVTALADYNNLAVLLPEVGLNDMTQEPIPLVAAGAGAEAGLDVQFDCVLAMFFYVNVFPVAGMYGKVSIDVFKDLVDWLPYTTAYSPTQSLSSSPDPSQIYAIIGGTFILPCLKGQRLIPSLMLWDRGGATPAISGSVLMFSQIG